MRNGPGGASAVRVGRAGAVVCMVVLSTLFAAASAEPDVGRDDLGVAGPAAVDLPPPTVPRFGRPVYQDVTNASGLGDFLHAGYLGPGNVFDPPAVFIEAMGPGACWLDADGDGWLDLYLVNGRYHTHPEKNDGLDPRSQLFRNRGDGTFEDVTDASGTALRGDHQGCAAADIDNDGDADLWVTGWGGNALFQNDGSGVFVDIAAEAGVHMPTCSDGFACWSTSVAFLDADRDGCLDAYLGHFEELDLANPPPVNGPGAGQRDRFFRGDCHGVFTNLTEEAGLWHVKSNTWSTVAIDLDDDGDTDLYSSNDGDRNNLWINQGNGTFVLKQDSVANDPYSGMGTAIADFDRSGRPDIVTTNWHIQMNGIYRAEGDDYVSIGGDPPFDDASPHSGWATHWLDMNHDGLLDLMVVNGNTEDLGWFPVRQPLLAYEQRDDGGFRSVHSDVGPGFLRELVGRGGAWADYDEDGDLDVQVSQAGENPTVLLRADETPGNFLTVRLVGTAAGVTRDAVGAKVTVSGPGLPPQTLEKVIGSGFMSSNDPRIHFGLGAAEAVNVSVWWPNGDTVSYRDVRANSFVTVEQGAPLVVDRALPLVRVSGAEVVDRLDHTTLVADWVAGDVPVVDSWWTLSDGRTVSGDRVNVSYDTIGWRNVKYTVQDAAGRTVSHGHRLFVIDELEARVEMSEAAYGPLEPPTGVVSVHYANGDAVVGAEVSIMVRHATAETFFGQNGSSAPPVVAYKAGFLRQYDAGATDHSGSWSFVVPFNRFVGLDAVGSVSASQVGRYEVEAFAEFAGVSSPAAHTSYMVSPVWAPSPNPV